MRAGYGSKLRSWIKQFSIDSIVDFGDLPVFEEATTYPCLWSIKKATPKLPMFDVSIIDTLSFPNGLANYVKEKKFEVNLLELSETGWTLVNNDIQHLLKKIKSVGIPLGEYVEGKIFRGLLTGLNEAFVIDEATKNNLIAADPKSAEVIKPFLSGREIKRYQNPKVEKHLIFIPKGFTIKRNLSSDDPNYISEAMHRYGNMDVDDAWSWFSINYPAISNYLLPFKERAEARTDQGDFWWELRACDYYNEFEKEKIMLPDISLKCEALYDKDGFYIANTAYIIVGLSKFHLGILNSKLVLFFYSNLTQTIRGGYYRFIRQYLEQIPIPEIPENIKLLLTDKVNEIISAKKNNPSLDTLTLEKEIDLMVYQLFGLTVEEIKIIENE